ncbi:MAG: hypothetical protein HQK53_07005, partial [Oligoflexia bacterium]|nr:hypothetical protein [Oligoflexia bacterium]
IIYFNGPSSAGKTTIIKKLQEVLETPFLHIGIDKLIGMMPAKLNDWTGKNISKDGFGWKQVKQDESCYYELFVGPFAEKISSSLKTMVLHLAEEGYSLMVDDVSFGGTEIIKWRDTLRNFNTLFVGVTAPLDILEKREKKRGDRIVGSARGQYFAVHNDAKYDILLDTHSMNIEQCLSSVIRKLELLEIGVEVNSKSISKSSRVSFPESALSSTLASSSSSSSLSSLPKIIAIMGISGAGKTVLTKSLSKALNATAIFWDDFDPISSGPDDLVKWYLQSRDVNDWKYDELARVLRELKEGQNVSCPLTAKELVPTKYIIFDAPLGRRHTATAKYIDQLILIDTPLDVALVRRLLREKNSALLHGSIYDELNFYLEHSRPLFVIDDECRRQCDLILTGEASITSVDKLTARVVSWLNCS